jgi:hypothetical protein
MDKFIPQSSGLEVREGHEESDLSVRGIVMSAIALAVAGFMSFGLMRGFLVVLEKVEPKIFPQAELTASQKQLIQEREPKPRLKPEEGDRLAPGREDEEVRLERTFVTPRLQQDDVRDMTMFRESEDSWLASSGVDTAGNPHVAVEDAMKAIVDHGLPQVSGGFAPPTLPTAVPMVPAQQRK